MGGASALAGIGSVAGSYPGAEPAASSLVVVAHGSPVTGSAPLTVHFWAEAHAGTGVYTQYFWSFGNGDEGAGLELNYTFGDAGNYTVRLNVTDSHGDTGEGQILISVDPAVVSPPTNPNAWELPLAVLVVVAVVVAAIFQFTRRRPAGTDGTSPSEEPEGIPEALDAESGIADGPEVVLPEPEPEDTTTPVLPSEMQEAGPPTERTDPVGDLRLSQRVILHMLRQGSVGADEIAPFGLTQPGMVSGIGASQSAVSNVLKRLAAAGVVSASTRHVAGHPRRLRVYALTPYGYELARDLQRRRPPSFSPR